MKVRLGDLTRIKTGKLDANASSPNGAYPFFTCSKEPLRIDSYSYDCECVLVAGNGDLNVKYYNGKFDAYQRTYIIEENGKNKLFMPYLYFFMDGYVEELRKLSIGGVIKYIKLGNLTDALIELPDIYRQKSIVNILAKTKGIIDNRKQELQFFDDLIKARFVEMFGDPEAGACKYETEKLGKLSVKISDGVHAKPVYTETGRPFLSVVNINKGVVDFTDCKYVSEDAYQKMIKSTHPEKGDVLYTKVGATYGIPAYVDTEKEFCLYVSVCLIKPKHERINSRFLSIQMAMPSIKHQADARIKGIGVPDLHLNQISEFNVILPPRELQDRFVEFVSQVDKSKVAVQKALDETQTLFDSLMQEYFG